MIIAKRGNPNKESVLKHFDKNYTEFYQKYFPEIREGKNVICPFHEESKPSLSICLTGEKAGLWNCFSCGAKGDVFSFYARTNGLDTNHQFPKVLDGIANEFGIGVVNIGPPPSIKTSSIETTTSTVKIRTLKERGISKKTAEYFEIQELPGIGRLSTMIQFPIHDKNGNKVNKKTHKGPQTSGAVAQLYPWEALGHDTVYVVNGEPSVWRACEAGYTNVVCGTCGEGTFSEAWTDEFADKTVRLVLDNDDPGRKGIMKIGKLLCGVAGKIEVVEWPQGWKEKGDVEDWLNEGKTLEDLDFTDWHPSELPSDDEELDLNSQRITEFMSEPKKVEWLIEPILPVDGRLILTGDAGVGKSTLALDLAISVARGKPWLGRHPSRRGKVLIVDEENGDMLLHDRLARQLKGHGVSPHEIDIEILSNNGIDLSRAEHINIFERKLKEIRPDVVIIDTFPTVFLVDENDSLAVRKALKPITNWIKELKCSFVILHHNRKPGANGRDTSNAFRGSTVFKAWPESLIDIKAFSSPEDGVTSVLLTHTKSRVSLPFAAHVVDFRNAESGGCTTVLAVAGPVVQQVSKTENGHKQFAAKMKEMGRLKRQDFLSTAGSTGISETTLGRIWSAAKSSGKYEIERDGKEVILVAKQRPPSVSPK